MTKRRGSKRRRPVAPPSRRPDPGPVKVLKVRLTCPACGWHDPGAVEMDGRVFGCPHCETKVFGYDGRPVYFHGGQAGLIPGGKILPPDVTGTTGTLREEIIRMGLADKGVARGDRVYLVTEWASSVMYAVLHPSLGQVYLVEPDGELEPDPDCTEPGLAWQCPSATILKAITVEPSEVQAVFRTLRYWTAQQGREGRENDGRSEATTEQEREPETTESGAQAPGR